MNISFFIAKHLSREKQAGFSRLIIRLAIAAVAISISVMILSMAIAKGYQHEIRDKITGFNAHIQLTHLDLNNSYESVPIRRDSAFERLLTHTPGLKFVQQYAIKTGIIKTDNDFQGIVLKGVSKDYNWNFLISSLESGHILSFPQRESSKGIVISRSTADKLQLKLGGPVLIYFVQDPPRVRKFTVTGIFETGFTEMDDLYAFVDIRQVQRLNNWDAADISGYEVNAGDFNLITAALAKLAEITPYYMGIAGIYSRYPQLFDWLDLLDMNVVIIILLMILVSCINMITALMILILERSNMIGLLKAMGSTDFSISKIFLHMAARIIFTGLLIGNVAGVGLALIQKNYGWIKLNQSSYYISKVPIELHLNDVLLINAGSFLVCMLILVLPSRFVGRISPVKTMRYD